MGWAKEGGEKGAKVGWPIRPSFHAVVAAEAEEYTFLFAKMLLVSRFKKMSSHQKKNYRET